MDGYVGSGPKHTNPTLDTDAVYWPPSYTQRAPLHSNISMHGSGTFSDHWQWSRHGSNSNSFPVAASQSNTSQQGPRKRMMKEEQFHGYGKRTRQEESQLNPMPLMEMPNNTQYHHAIQHGTQHNPFEIESSPEPELSTASKIEGSGIAPPAPRHHSRHFLRYIGVPDAAVNWSVYYAVARGRVPGLYRDWSLAEQQISRYSGGLHKKFKNQEDAWTYINGHRENFERGSLRPKEGTCESTKALLTEDEHTADQILLPSLPVPDTYACTYATSTPSPKVGLQPVKDDMPKPFEQEPPAQDYQSRSIPGDNFVPAPEPAVQLSAEQRHVVNLIVKGGRNVFYTGSAGCGKSTILKAFVRELKAQGKRVRIVAPTNLAALNVNGQTTWAFAGWTPDSMKRPLDKLKAAAHGNEVWKRFDSTDVLVIDEISMVENLQFERLNEIMKASLAGKKTGPFGGVQIVATGDFCQLSPVKPFAYCIGCGWELIHEEKDRELLHRCENKNCGYDMWPDTDKWAFRSKAWQECNFAHVNLTEIFRQNDRKFISILQKIRRDGVIVNNHARILLNHTSETENAIKIFSLRQDVDRVNLESIRRLPSESRIYNCLDNFYWRAHHRDDASLSKYTMPAANGSNTLHQLKEHRYEASLELKEGMRVVLQSNLSPQSGLVNGAQGTIIGFEPFDLTKLPRKANGNLEGPGFLKGPHADYIKDQIEAFAKANQLQAWPIVRFDSDMTKTIYADCSYSELGNEEKRKEQGEPEQEPSLLSRTQIPLVAGYAITVHKSQGMTLERVIVDLRDAFEASQIYVALSRARSLRGLKVVSLPRKNLGGANKQVKEFFDTYLDRKVPHVVSKPEEQEVYV